MTQILLFLLASVSWDPSGKSLAPPLVWSSWDFLGCNYNDTYLRGVADAISGGDLGAAGFNTMLIQGCIVPVGSRDMTTGAPIVDPVKFPNGLGELVQYIKSKNISVGVAMSVGNTTCEGFEGSYGHEVVDVGAYDGWGVDFLKAEQCGVLDGESIKDLFGKVQGAIEGGKAETLLYMDAMGEGGVETWGPDVGTSWSTNTGLNGTTTTYKMMFDSFVAGIAFPNATRVGAWQDLGMLIVGSTELTPEEWETHFSLWAIASSPLLASFDIQTPPFGVISVITNSDVLSISQDSLGKMGFLVTPGNASSVTTPNSVWARPLAPLPTESQAVCVLLVNTDSAQATVSLTFTDLFPSTSVVSTARDLWEHKELGQLTDKFSANIAPHVSVMLRLGISK